MMYYPDELVEEVRMKNDIVDVVSGYVKIQKKGSSYFGLCPFHNEKSPSFSVSPGKQMYYCFGCGAGGNVFSFVMQYENFTFPEAVKMLAERAGVNLPEVEYTEEMRRKEDRRSRLLEINKLAATYFFYQLRSERGKAGLEYLKKRELSDETIRHWGLGFSNVTSNDLVKYLKSKGYDDQIIQEAGLASFDERYGLHDKFWNRVMFPIMDVNSRVIGFGGRVMGDAKPKYLNSPETEIFNKRKNLFALNIAKKSKQGRMILTEGYMDAISLHQYGFDCAVASLGTSLTEEHAAILAKYVPEVVLTYDGDEAGQNATRRAIPMLEKVGLRVKVLRMQGAKDPDEFLKKYGADRFSLLLDKSENQAEYQLESLKRKYDLTDDEQRVEFLQKAAQLISTFPSAVQREIYGARAAEAAGISADAMKLEVTKAYKKRRAIEQKKQREIDLSPARQQQPLVRSIRYDNVRSAVAEEGLLRMLLKEPELIPTVRLPGEHCSVPLFGHVLELLRERFAHGQPVTLGALEGTLSREEMEHLTMVVNRKDMTVSEQAMDDYIRTIEEEYTRTHCRGGDTLLQMARQKKETGGYGG